MESRMEHEKDNEVEAVGWQGYMVQRRRAPPPPNGHEPK